MLVFRPTPSRERGRRIFVEAFPAQRGGLKSAGPCQNRLPGATPRRPESVDFWKDSPLNGPAKLRPVRAALALRWGWAQNTRTRPIPSGPSGLT